MNKLAFPMLLLLGACGVSSQPDAPAQARQALSQCPSATVTGIDVSDGNGPIDWAAVHGAGVDFAYIKATQGTYNTNTRFSTNWADARANGVARGAYHFFDPTEDGVAQAQTFLAALGTLQPGDLPPMLDVECPDGDSACLGWAGASGDAPPADIHQRVLDFLTTVEQATGRKPGIYTFPSYFSSNSIADADLAGYPLWLASLSSGGCFDVPTAWSSAVIWQWDWHGTVAGISGEVDQDRFVGTLADLQAFGQGGPFRPHRGQVADLNGDGRADLCGRSPTGIACWLAGDGGFGVRIDGPALADDAGWSDSLYAQTIQFADVDGDGRSDLCARGPDGFGCWRSTGAGFGARLAGPGWSDATGWAAPRYASTIQLADIDGDGRADVCGRGAAGLSCYLSSGSGFPTLVTGPALSDANDWGSPQYYATLQFPDIDGDGKADVCARASRGIVCWLSTGSGFSSQMLTGPDWSDAAGWDQARYYSTIQFGDVDGDGKADVCGRGPAGFECWLSDGAGFPTQVSGPAWSDANGWDLLPYDATLQLADVDGDHKADVCGRSSVGVVCWLSAGAPFSTRVDGPALSDATGWDGLPYYWTIELGDVTGDGKADLCARAAAGYRCWPSTGSGFGSAIELSDVADAQGWDQVGAFASLRLVGGKPGSTSGSTTGTTGTSGSTGGAGTTGGTSAGSSSTGSTGSIDSTGSVGSTGTTGALAAPDKKTSTRGCGSAEGGASLSAWCLVGALAWLRRRTH